MAPGPLPARLRWRERGQRQREQSENLGGAGQRNPRVPGEPAPECLPHLSLCLPEICLLGAVHLTVNDQHVRQAADVPGLHLRGEGGTWKWEPLGRLRAGFGTSSPPRLRSWGHFQDNGAPAAPGGFLPAQSLPLREEFTEPRKYPRAASRARNRISGIRSGGSPVTNGETAPLTPLSHSPSCLCSLPGSPWAGISHSSHTRLACSAPSRCCASKSERTRNPWLVFLEGERRITSPPQHTNLDQLSSAKPLGFSSQPPARRSSPKRCLSVAKSSAGWKRTPGAEAAPGCRCVPAGKTMDNKAPPS